MLDFTSSFISYGVGNKRLWGKRFAPLPRRMRVAPSCDVRPYYFIGNSRIATDIGRITQGGTIGFGAGIYTKIPSSPFQAIGKSATGLPSLPSTDTEIEGITKVLAIDRAKDFYLNIGFQENPEYPRELILTKVAAFFISTRPIRTPKRKMMTSEKYQHSAVDLKRWSELDELGMTAMCGTPMSDEEYEQRLQSGK